MDGNRYTVGQLVEVVARPEEPEPALLKEIADHHLRQLGLRVMRDHLMISNRSERVPRKLGHTRPQQRYRKFAGPLPRWIKALRAIKGIHPWGPYVRFCSGV